MNFFNKVYDAVRLIPKGKVTSYGEIAKFVGNPRASRAVGYALHKNPQPGVIPCHRVVNREGRLAPAFAFGGMDVQKAMLKEENVILNEDGYVDLTKYGFSFRDLHK